MKVVICGPIVPEEIEYQLPNFSPASGKYLRNLKQGLEKNDIEVNCVSFLSVPEAKQILGRKVKINDIIVIPKDKTVFMSVLRYHKIVNDIVNKDDIVFFYNFRYSEWGLLHKLKKKHSRCKLILADHTSYREEKSITKRIISWLNEKEYKKFNEVVLLSENAKALVDKNAKINLVEGGIDYNEFCNIKKPQRDSKCMLLYSGTLSYVTGVDRLLEAFSQINSNKIELYITGKGELEELVKDAAHSDSRINFLGYVSNDYLVQIMNKATILVNPRNMSLEQNQNNFPSKVLEYLATGRIVISTKFPGWEKWKEYFTFYDGSADELKIILNHYCDNSFIDFDQKYETNRIIAKQFDWKYQSMQMIQ